MKYLNIFVIAAFTFFFYNSLNANNTPKKATNIQLKVNGLSNEWVYLNNFQEDRRSKVDSALMDKEGNASFKSKDLLEGYYYVILPDSVVIDLLIGEDQVFSLTTNLTSPIADMQVEGSLENELLYNNLKYDLGLKDRYQAEIDKAKASGTEVTNRLTNQIQYQLSNRLE